MDGDCRITSIIAHIDHGKTTVMDSLVAYQGHISKSLAGDLRYLDNRADEQSRKITLKLSPIKLGNGHVFIDTPGHVDFESLIFCSSVLADNFLILVDVNEGITPRTYSLVKYINKRRSVLILNKIDLCQEFDQVQLVIYQLNGLIGDEVFSWEKNNVILSCASLCSGVNCELFRFGKKNTLKNAFSAFKLLDRRYEDGEVDQILEKYKIKFKTKKNVFSSVMPLYSSIFSTINWICEARGGCADGGAVDSGSQEVVGGHGFRVSADLYEISSSNTPALLGITVYGMFREKQLYTKENVLFVTRLFHGRIRRGDLVYNATNDECRKVSIEGIYDFSVERFVELDAAEGPSLVCLKGGFLKNSVISSDPVDFHMCHFLTPFYMSKVVLRDLSLLPSMKETVQAIAYTEQCLKVKKNRFSELEVRCSGAVQFEKVCADLVDAGYAIDVRDARREFREYPSECVERHYKDENTEFTVKMGRSCDFDGGVLLAASSPNANKSDRTFVEVRARHDNVFYIRSDVSSHIIESVLEMFVDSGPFIRENVVSAYIYVDILMETGSKIYNTLRNELSSLYLESKPRICPHLFSLRISIEKEYLGDVYTALDRIFSLLDEEVFNEETGFFILRCRIAQFSLKSAIQEINIKTRGTAYVEVEDAGYTPDGDFSALVDSIRSEKGMHTDRKIVENPEKQRTHKK